MEVSRAKGSGLVAALLCGSGLLWLALPTNATAAALSVTAAPAEVALTPGSSAPGVLLISNPSMRRVRVQVRAVSDQSITVDGIPHAAAVPAEGSTSLRFTVRRTSEGTGQNGTVVFTVVPEAPSPLAAVAASVSVKAAGSLALVEAKIEPSIKTINENRPGEVALVITNLRETEVRVEQIEALAPQQVTVTMSCPTGPEVKALAGTIGRGCSFPVRSLSQEILQIRLDPADRVVPGPRSLLINVDVSRPGGGSSSVVATSAFDIDIFAESDVLKSVGVPVFLLLPGVIVLLVFWFLIQKASPWRRPASEASFGDALQKAGITAIAGLGVSLLIAIAYPHLTALAPGGSRDYLKAYGFRDFYYVFGWSFVIALCAWAVASIPGFFIPMPGDTPTTLLRKIGLRGLLGGEATFEKVTVDGGKGGLRLGKRPGDKILVAPVVAAEIKADAPGLRGKIEGKTDRERPLAAFLLWLLVARAVDGGKASIDYRSSDVDEPVLVEASKVASSGNKLPIVEATSA